MKLSLCAVGRLKDSTENQLTRDYLKRADLSARVLGITSVDLIEVEAKRGIKPSSSEHLKSLEAEAITDAIGTDVILVACDERGEGLTSRQIAKRLETYKDKGERRVVFLIGGADGLDPSLRQSATFCLAFGPQTWPHALVRVMLAEQMYRAISILTGHPYHRD